MKNMTRRPSFKILLFLIFVFGSLFLISGTGFGAPVGNPAGPVLLEGNYPTKVTLEVEGVYRRKLKSDYGNNPDFSGMFYTGKVSLYNGNKLDFYGLVGLYEGQVKNFIDDNYKIVSKADIAYGAGISYVIHQLEFVGGVLRLGADAKFRMFEPDIDTVKWYREKIETSHNSMTFKEWQASLGLAYQYKFLTPYIGAKYSDMNAHIHFTEGSTTYSDKNLESVKKWGLFYGLDVLLGDSVSFNIEGRHIDERAINVGLNVRF